MIITAKSGRAYYRAGFVGSGQHCKPSEEEERENEFVLSLNIYHGKHHHDDIKAVLAVVLGLSGLVNTSNPAKKRREKMSSYSAFIIITAKPCWLSARLATLL